MGASLGASLIAVVSAGSNAAFAPEAHTSESHNLPEAPFVATPMNVVARMLDMARVRPKDVVIDLGCGDGRIVAEAAKRGARVLSHDWDMGDWIPDASAILDVPDKPICGDKKNRVLMWAMPPRVRD